MAHCCGDSGILKLEVPAGGRKIVLAGNPNVGKSVFFNNLTGLYVDVSNYPGTTLEISHGRYGQDLIIDTPGVYGISSFNDEERIARDIILEADLVINVVDAVHLARDLFLTQQIIDTGVPVVVALNILDEAARHGLTVDHQALGSLLGVPVVPTVATAKEGMDSLKHVLNQARRGQILPLVQELLSQIPSEIKQGEALLVLEGDEIVSARRGLAAGDKREMIYQARRERVDKITEQVVKNTTRGASYSTLLGRWMLRPVSGTIFLLVTLYLIYKIIGTVVAGNVVGFTEETVMQGIYEPFIRSVVGSLLKPESIPGQFLIGEFGLLTMTPTYVLGLLLPLVMGFYLILSLLEDSGYLPRIAALVDRVMNAIGLNGRAVIPLLLGFGCVTLATIVTRLLGSERERRIAIFLLALAIPCSAQLGIIAGILAGMGTAYIFLYVLIVFVIMAVTGTWLNQLLPGKSSELLIDLPPLRLPKIRNVLQKTGIKSLQFIKEATPIFALGAVLISVLQLSGVLVFFQKLLAPLTVGWLNLPPESATVFIMGIIRRDFGAAGLSNLTLTPMQSLVSLVTLTLFVPCIAAMLVLIKERGKKEAPFIWVGSWLIAFLVGGIIAQLNLAFPGKGIIAVALFFILFLLATIISISLLKRSARLKAVVKEGSL